MLRVLNKVKKNLRVSLPSEKKNSVKLHLTKLLPIIFKIKWNISAISKFQLSYYLMIGYIWYISNSYIDIQC